MRQSTVNFDNLTIRPHFRGKMRQGLFENGYGVSVIPEGDGETYELAVLTHSNGNKQQLSYDTPVTNDVIRYATLNAINTLIDKVRNLPPV